MTAYTYRTIATGQTISEPCASIWAALDRAEYHLEQQTEQIEPVAITTGRCSFNAAHIATLLTTYTDPRIIRREAATASTS